MFQSGEKGKSKLTKFSWSGGVCLYARAALISDVTASAPHSLILTLGCWQISDRCAVRGRHSTSMRGRLTNPVSRSLATAKREGSCCDSKEEKRVLKGKATNTKQYKTCYLSWINLTFKTQFWWNVSTEHQHQVYNHRLYTKPMISTWSSLGQLRSNPQTWQTTFGVGQLN